MVVTDTAAPLPAWIDFLEAAEEWKLPPWELAGDNNRLLWMIRRRVYREIVAEAVRERNTPGGD